MEQIQGIIENISRETSQDLKRKKSTVRLDQSKPTPQQKRQNTREGSREPSPLSKGLNFIPTPKKEHQSKLLQDILLFDRRLRLKYFFHHNN